MAPPAQPGQPARPVQGKIKCVVWDLDNTLWDGTLLEDGEVTLRPAVAGHIRRLDRMGVLNSVASKNDHDTAMARLAALGLADLFLYPQVNWNAKSASIERIAGKLNLGLDAFAFVDDQEFERAEVAAALPAGDVRRRGPAGHRAGPPGVLAPVRHRRVGPAPRHVPQPARPR